MQWPVNRAVVAAEIGLSHDGSLAIAHSLVDSIADAGADVVKFQVHVADSESTYNEKFRDSREIRDKRRYAYWERTAFSPSEWHELVSHVRERDLEPIASTFSPAGIELVAELGLQTWKIGSAEARQPWFVRQVLERAESLVCSTGMSNQFEISELVELCTASNKPTVLVQCTSMYPTPLAEVGLNVLGDFRERYGLPVGVSDHSGSVVPAIAAMALGALFVEVHVTYSRHMRGPDSSSSLDFEELGQLVRARDQISEMLLNPVDKDAVAEKLQSTREVFGRSLGINRELRAGELLTAEVLVPKKPGGGIPVSELDRVVGSHATRNLSPKWLLVPEDFRP